MNNKSFNSNLKNFEFSDTTKKALVSNKNIILYYYYLKNENFNNNLFSDKIEKNFYLDKNEWSSLEEYVNIVDKAIALSGNFELPKIVGALLLKYQKEYKLHEFARMAKQNIKAFFWGPVEIFRQISFYNYLFNKTKDMEFLSGGNGQCFIKTKFKPGVNPVFDFVSEWHIEGMYKAVFDLFGIRNYVFRNILKEYDLELLIKKKFTRLNKNCYEKDNLLYLGDEIIARKITLLSSVFSKKPKMKNFYRSFETNDKKWAWLIEKDVLMDNKYLVLKKGDVYNAPYFLTTITWQKKSYLKASVNLLKSINSNVSPFGREYGRLIKERLIQERESTKLRLQKQKIEEEYNYLLIKNYIHPAFIKKAMSGPIPFRNVFVSNIFLDINGSTQLRKKYGNGAFRVNKNILLRVVKEALREAGGSWGWLNKVMGDGCYVVFGTYNYFKDNQDSKHAFEAIKFASLVLQKIKEIKSKNKVFFPDLCLRFGIESGYVEIGENYEKNLEKEDQKLDLSHLRIFDTDGHAVSLAFRIEQTSKIILEKLNQEKENAILLGPRIIGLIKKDKNLAKDLFIIDLKKMEINIRDYDKVNFLGGFFKKC